MKVLFLNAYFEPEVAASLYLCSNLCEDLTKNGFEVELFTPYPTRGVTDAVRAEYSNRGLETLFEGKFTVRRFRLPQEPRSALLRALRYLWMEILLLRSALRTHYDVVFLYSTPPTQGAIGAILRIVRRKPVIYNLQDVFPDSLAHTGLAPRSSAIYRLGTVLESFAYRYVDRIIVISENFRMNLLAKGVPEEKIDLVRNWVDEEEVHPVDRSRNTLFERYQLDRDKFYVSYCGNIGLTQNFEMLLEIAQDLSRYDDIRFLIVGDGVYRSELVRKMKNANLQNIAIIPFQPYDEIASVFSAGDVGLVISKANVGQTSVPSKTWSIMCAEKPVLASFDRDSELSRLIEAQHCGIAVDAEDKMALQAAILRTYHGREESTAMGVNGRKYIMSHLTRPVGTGQIIDIVSKLAGSGEGERYTELKLRRRGAA